MKMFSKFLPAAQQSEHKKQHIICFWDFIALVVVSAVHRLVGKSTPTLHNVNLVAGVKDNWLDFHNQIWEI